MSQINVGTANANILQLGSYNGVDNFPTGLTASDAGSMIYDSSTGQLAFWNGSDWRLVKGGGTQDGLTPEGAFSNLSDVADKGYTGIQTLYTTLNDSVSAVRISPSGAYVASGDESGLLLVWLTSTLRVVHNKKWLTD